MKPNNCHECKRSYTFGGNYFCRDISLATGNLNNYNNKTPDLCPLIKEEEEKEKQDNDVFSFFEDKVNWFLSEIENERNLKSVENNYYKNGLVIKVKIELEKK